MKKNVNKVKCDIQSHIIAAGYTQKEAVKPVPLNMAGATATPTSLTSWTSRPCGTRKYCSWQRFSGMRLYGSDGGMLDGKSAVCNPAVRQI